MAKGTPPGRPPKGKPRQVRWEDDEWEDIRLAGERMGMTRSEYIRRIVDWDVQRLKKG